MKAVIYTTENEKTKVSIAVENRWLVPENSIALHIGVVMM